MKSFRFIRRFPCFCKNYCWHSDRLEIINADTLEEAMSLYGFKDEPNTQVKEISNRKGCVLAYHISTGQ